MGLFDVFSNLSESKETHPLSSMRTHYYKTNYQTLKKTLLDLAKASQWQIESENDTYGEVFIRGKKFHMIATIIQTYPSETAIDLKVQTYYFFGFNRPKKIIQSTFEKLNQKVSLKGLGLKP
jgi:hypothetical protein